MIKEERLDNWEAFARVLRLCTEFDGSRLWWRGHGDGNWSLVAGVHRVPRPKAEAPMANRFRAAANARRTLGCPVYGAVVDWLLLMQHYGLPTRLMDWTEGLLIALHFAVRDRTLDNREGVVWGCSPADLNTAFHGQKSALYGSDWSVVKTLADQAFTGPSAKPPAVTTAAFVPNHFDARMMVQLSQCTIHHDNTPLETHPNADSFLIKVVVPADSKESWRLALDNLGVRGEVLFPDLEGLATALKATWAR